jgi:hypothetical protein
MTIKTDQKSVQVLTVILPNTLRVCSKSYRMRTIRTKKITTGENRHSTCKRIEPGSESGRTEKITTGENRQADRDGVLERRNENLSPGTNPRAIEKSTA